MHADVVCTWSRLGQMAESRCHKRFELVALEAHELHANHTVDPKQFGHQLPQRVLIAGFVGAVGGDQQGSGEEARLRLR